MDPLNDCPICFETYEPESEVPQGEERPEPVGRHWAVKLDCCQQSLCCHCQLCLARCPFCRIRWHGDQEEEENGGHFWQRRSFPNPILTVWGTTLAFDAIRVMASAGMSGVRVVATAAAAAVAEASPVVLVGGAAGAAAIAGGYALMKAAEHSPQQAERLRTSVRDRERYQLVPDEERRESFQMAVQRAVVCIWDALQWHLSPQWAGMPHVYTGSPWRAEARQKHHQSLSSLLTASTSETAASSDAALLSGRLWGDLIFLFLLWLDFNPHTPNWGSSHSYGLPPMHLCWHNRWREDLRHVVSDFARCLQSEAVEAGLPAKEKDMAECLVAMLDHILSWEVMTLDRGSSDLIKASWWNYPSFCKNLQERFAEAWAATVAPPEAEVECRSFQTHAEAMAERELPDEFHNLWCM